MKPLQIWLPLLDPALTDARTQARPGACAGTVGVVTRRSISLHCGRRRRARGDNR